MPELGAEVDDILQHHQQIDYVNTENDEAERIKIQEFMCGCNSRRTNNCKDIPTSCSSNNYLRILFIRIWLD